MNFSTLEGIFRIIQSIPSKKAEPIKRWLAAVGAERINQMQDPEKSIELTGMHYPMATRKHFDIINASFHIWRRFGQP